MSADSLIDKVVLATFWPSTEANRPRTNAQILSLADDVILGECWPKMIAGRADRYVCTLDYTLVAEFSRYRIPSRTYGPLRDVLWVDDDGNEADVPLIDLAQLGDVTELRNATRYHYFDGDYIGIYPEPDSGVSGTLRVRYYRAPSTLVLLASATTVTAVDLETDDTSFSVDDPSAFAEDDEIDVIAAGNAHQVLVEDATIDDISGDVFTTADSMEGSGIQVGDYVTQAGTTPIVQLPDELLPWLVQLVASRALEGNDEAASDRLARRAADIWRSVQAIAKPRTDGASESWVDPLNPYRLR